jgi:glycosyltransferase involved in cell wall biosynthesis
MITTGQPAHDRPTICHLVLSLDVGGAELLARDYIAQAAHGFRSVLACLDRAGSLAGELQQAGCPVTVIGRGQGIDLGCAWRLRRFCQAQHVRLIHAHLYGPFLYAALARLPALGIPVLYTEHGLSGPNHPRRTRLVNPWLLRGGDRVVAVSRAVREWLVDELGFPAHRVEVVWNGIDLGPCAAPPGERAVVRGEFGLDPAAPLIVQVGRLAPVKNHRLALEAFQRIAARFPAVGLLLVGDGPERVTLEQDVDRRGLNGRVVFTGHRTDVSRLLRAADVALSTSRSEGMPLGMIESMAAGLPCVATRVGGNPEVVVDRQTGFLVASDDAQQVADRLTDLLADADLRERMGAAARHRAEAMFDARTMHATYRRMYCQMLNVSWSMNTLHAKETSSCA